MKEQTKGRVTIPTDVDVVAETLELVERWGADAIREVPLYLLYYKEG